MISNYLPRNTDNDFNVGNCGIGWNVGTGGTRFYTWVSYDRSYLWMINRSDIKMSHCLNTAGQVMFWQLIINYSVITKWPKIIKPIQSKSATAWHWRSDSLFNKTSVINMSIDQMVRPQRQRRKRDQILINQLCWSSLPSQWRWFWRLLSRHLTFLSVFIRLLRTSLCSVSGLNGV